MMSPSSSATSPSTTRVVIVSKTASQLLAAALAAVLLPAAPADAAVVSRFVMRINDEVATLRDYEQRKEELEKAILTRPDLTLQQRREALGQLGERVYRNMYEDLLLVSRARQLGITVTDEEVDEQLGRIRERMGLTADEDFQGALASSGLTLAQLREQTRKNLLSQTVLGREVYSQIEVDEEILRRYYRDHPDQFQEPEKLHLRSVVVLAEATPDPGQRRELAAAIRAEVAAGRPLDEVAAERAIAGTTSGLIDLGWVAPGDLDPGLERAVWGLATGALSEPIEARGGAHLVEVVAREAAFLRPFSEVAEEIRALERERRAAQEIEEYFTRLEDQAFIDLDPPPEAAGFRRLAAEPPVGPELVAPAAAGDGAAPPAPETEAAVPAAEENETEIEAGGDPGEPVPPSSPEPPPPGGG
jgi:parvulin-like peptidyl-prolyl isomerase